MKFTVYRLVFVFSLTIFFFLAQTLPVVTLFAQGTCSTMSAGLNNGQSKSGCCCCDSSACPCDLKKDQAGEPMSSDLAFTTHTGYQNFEEVIFFRDSIKNGHPDARTYANFWIFARAPCPEIYLATLSLLC